MALSCAAIVCGGCSLFLSTSDLSEEPPSVDGGASVDAPLDAPPVHVGEAGTEGGGDAGPPPGDAAVPFCKSLSPAPKFCDDFEGDAGFFPAWDESFVDPMGAGGVTKEDAAVVTRLVGAPDCSYARLVKGLATSGNGMRISFSMRPSAPWPSDRIFFAAFLHGAVETCAILLHLTPTEARTHLQYGNPQKDDQTEWSSFPVADTWSRVALEIGAQGVVVFVDQQKVSTQPLSPGCSFGIEVETTFGYHCADGVSEIRYDDVTVDYP